MAHLFVSDPGNSRRLVATTGEGNTLRGFLHQEPDGRTVTIPVEWGPSADGKHETVCFTARLWPGGATLADVVRPWRRGGDWHSAWNEMRRQVRDITTIDVGEPPHHRGFAGRPAEEPPSAGS